VKYCENEESSNSNTKTKTKKSVNRSNNNAHSQLRRYGFLYSCVDVAASLYVIPFETV